MCTYAHVRCSLMMKGYCRMMKIYIEMIIVEWWWWMV